MHWNVQNKKDDFTDNRLTRYPTKANKKTAQNQNSPSDSRKAHATHCMHIACFYMKKNFYA